LRNSVRKTSDARPSADQSRTSFVRAFLVALLIVSVSFQCLIAQTHFHRPATVAARSTAAASLIDCGAAPCATIQSPPSAPVDDQSHCLLCQAVGHTAALSTSLQPFPRPSAQAPAILGLPGDQLCASLCTDYGFRPRGPPVA
jgi:hypothetical protein